MRSEQETNRAIDRYADTVKRICMVHVKSYADTEDIFQTVFLKYALREAAFESDAHEKAWFIRVTINACNDILRNFFRRRTVPLESAPERAAAQEGGGEAVRSAVFALPPKYRDAVYLHYYEGYSAVEIARMLKKSENTVYTRLSRAKGLLKGALGGEEYAK